MMRVLRTVATSLLAVAVALPGLAMQASGAASATTSSTAAAQAPPTVDWYVAPDGVGRACVARMPCDLETAHQRVRNLPVQRADIVVHVTDGVYRLDEPLTLGKADSGRDGHTVTWRAAEGASPVISGGVPIAGWQVADDGTWQAPMPDGLTPRQLYVNGERAVRARGEGCDRQTECSWTEDGLTGPAAQRFAAFDEPDELEMSFRVRWRQYRCGVESIDGDLIRMEQPCWVNASRNKHRQPYNWGTTTLDGTRYDGPVFIENAREFLDEPGEFHVDTGAGTVAYVPREGETPAEANVIAPVTQTLVRVDGAEDVRIDGLAFAHTAWEQPSTTDGYAGAQSGFTITGDDGPEDLPGEHFTRQRAAVEIVGSSRITVNRSAFEHLGAAGVDIRAASSDVSITGNTFRDISGAAVYAGDTDPEPAEGDVSERNEVSGNTIEDIGLEFTDSVAIWAGYERELVIDHNTIERVPYSGISVGWGWTAVFDNPMRDNRITNNRIVDVMGHDIGMHDGGAIYTQGRQPGTVIAGNYINRVEYPDDDPALDGNGIYCDERSSDILVTGNVITRIGGKWLSNWASYGERITGEGNWADLVAPALAGRGSVLRDNHEGLSALPAEAIAVARAAGAGGAGDHRAVEQLLTVSAGLPENGTATVSVTVPNTTAETYRDVEVGLRVADGAGVEPGSVTVAEIGPGTEETVRFAVTPPAGADAGIEVEAVATYTVDGVGAGTASGWGTVSTTDVAPSFEATHNIVAITDDAEPAAGTFSNSGRSYSAQALADAGITPGGTITHRGVDITFPDVAAGEPNATFAQGQVFRMDGSGDTLVLAGAAAYGTHSGTGTVYYTDGTHEDFTLSYVDFFRPLQADDLLVTMPYSNQPDGQWVEDVGLYSNAIPIDSSKGVHAVRLPDSGTPSGPGLRVLAAGIG